jgi:hypothetical protein
MKILFAAILLPVALAAASDEQAQRQFFLREGARASEETTQRVAIAMNATVESQCPKGRKRFDKFDLGYRFNKFMFLDGSNITLDWKDYPLTDTLGYQLQNESNAISIVMKYDHEVKGLCIHKCI